MTSDKDNRIRFFFVCSIHMYSNLQSAYTSSDFALSLLTAFRFLVFFGCGRGRGISGNWHTRMSNHDMENSKISWWLPHTRHGSTRPSTAPSNRNPAELLPLAWPCLSSQSHKSIVLAFEARKAHGTFGGITTPRGSRASEKRLPRASQLCDFYLKTKQIGASEELTAPCT